MKPVLAWFRHQLDRIANRFNGHCPDDYTDCPPNCVACTRLQIRWDRMQRYLNERALPRVTIHRQPAPVVTRMHSYLHERTYPFESNCSQPGCTIPGCIAWHGVDA